MTWILKAQDEIARLADLAVAPVAQYTIGVMYAEGDGVPQDHNQARRLWLKAAEQGNAGAQYGLGVMYHEGQGVRRNYVEAMKWFRKAATQGDASAQYNLGFMYANGEGVRQDPVEAYKWFDLAASHYPPSEAEKRNDAIFNRDAIAAYMKPQQVAEAKNLARAWKTQASPTDTPPIAGSWIARVKSGQPLSVVLQDLQDALDRREVTAEDFAEIQRRLLLL